MEHTLEILSAAGLDFNAKDNNGMTALHWAALNNNSTQIKDLIKAGAYVNVTVDNPKNPSHGMTALHLTTIHGYTTATEAILNAIPDPIQKKILVHKIIDNPGQSFHGWTASTLAKHFNHPNVVNVLTIAGA